MRTLANIIREHITFRKQIRKLAKSDLIKTYRGSALGWAWALIKPLVTIFVFWFAFSHGLRQTSDVEGYPYILWIIAGFIPWFFMSEMITQGAACIRKNSHLVTKMKFPISTIPTFTSISKFIVHLLLMVITITIFCVAGHFPDVYYLQLPFYMLVMLAFFDFWALFAGMLSALSKDFQNLVNAFTTAIFWLSGIMYNVDNVKNPTIQLILAFNPVTTVAKGYRNIFIYKTWFWENPRDLICYCCTLLVMIVLALWAYRKLYKEIPDVL